ncbi:hypothetical protein BKA64DRAFT_744369 [Cadophora sp. MPI-SDFR-AT-0126]|nr:hypothetical protein BKA64DRAFT_744369 [Leotiomycetes sp. MPI-SDFR-AT-0126]
MQYSYTLLGLSALASANAFTSIYNVTASPSEVISNAGVSVPGPAGAKGQFNYAIDSTTDTICYDITLEGVVGDYQSPARTATHIHEGVKGRPGPPRIALPNPVGDDNYRHISGCLTGPFTTGIKGADNVTDTGAGFKLSQIEANPAGFFTDSHTVLYPAGVVRGQLDYKFEIITPGYPQGPVTTKTNDGHEITTATITKTYEITISSCKQEVTDCPYKTKPVVTKTEEVYTTVCPKSEVTKHYPPKTETHPAHETKTNEGHPSKPVETHPATKPVETHPVQGPTTTLHAPIATGTGLPKPTPTYEFTGAAGSNKVGGFLIAASFAAALL